MTTLMFLLIYHQVAFAPTCFHSGLSNLSFSAAEQQCVTLK